MQNNVIGKLLKVLNKLLKVSEILNSARTEGNDTLLSQVDVINAAVQLILLYNKSVETVRA